MLLHYTLKLRIFKFCLQDRTWSLLIVPKFLCLVQRYACGLYGQPNEGWQYLTSLNMVNLVSRMSLFPTYAVFGSTYHR